MKGKMFFILFSISLLSVNAVFAQDNAKTITNSDLEKFRQERLQGEKELRENYQELGFLSPEEQAEKDKQDAIERAELSERLRQERLEREQIQYEAQLNTQNANQYYYQDDTNYYRGYYRPYFYSFGNYNYKNNRGYRYNNRNGRLRRGNNGGFWAFGRYFPTTQSYFNFRRRQLNYNDTNRRNNTNHRPNRTRRNR